MLTKAQVQRLLKPRPGSRFEKKQGLTYIPAHEVKAELTRIFGPGNWDHTIHDVTLLWETEETVTPKNGGQAKQMYRACYSAACTLRVRDYAGNQIAEVTEYHAEANANLPDRGEAHAMALTSVQSYALRRAALDLGDAFGLHLYDGGQTTPLIRGTLMLEGDEDAPWSEAAERSAGADPSAADNPGPSDEETAAREEQVARALGGTRVEGASA